MTAWNGEETLAKQKGSGKDGEIIFNQHDRVSDEQKTTTNLPELDGSLMS